MYGGLQARDQGLLGTCYSESATRIILKLFKHPKIQLVDDIQTINPPILNQLNEFETKIIELIKQKREKSIELENAALNNNAAVEFQTNTIKSVYPHINNDNDTSVINVPSEIPDIIKPEIDKLFKNINGFQTKKNEIYPTVLSKPVNEQQEEFDRISKLAENLNSDFKTEHDKYITITDTNTKEYDQLKNEVLAWEKKEFAEITRTNDLLTRISAEIQKEDADLQRENARIQKSIADLTQKQNDLNMLRNAYSTQYAIKEQNINKTNKIDVENFNKWSNAEHTSIEVKSSEIKKMQIDIKTQADNYNEKNNLLTEKRKKYNKDTEDLHVKNDFYIKESKIRRETLTKKGNELTALLASLLEDITQKQTKLKTEINKISETQSSIMLNNNRRNDYFTSKTQIWSEFVKTLSSIVDTHTQKYMEIQKSVDNLNNSINNVFESRKTFLNKNNNLKKTIERQNDVFNAINNFIILKCGINGEASLKFFTWFTTYINDHTNFGPSKNESELISTSFENDQFEECKSQPICFKWDEETNSKVECTVDYKELFSLFKDFHQRLFSKRIKLSVKTFKPPNTPNLLNIIEDILNKTLYLHISCIFGPNSDFIEILQDSSRLEELNEENPENPSNYCGSKNSGGGNKDNHGLVIIGIEGDHVIIKNSWGYEWGDFGKFKIRKDALFNNLCIEYVTVIDMESQTLQNNGGKKSRHRKKNAKHRRTKKYKRTKPPKKNNKSTSRLVKARTGSHR